MEGTRNRNTALVAGIGPGSWVSRGGNATMPWEHERLFYRIRYPLAERPRLWSASCAHEAVDCCEGGIRYEPGSEPRPPIGAKVRGRIRFREGVEVEGVVVRVAKTEVAVSLTTHRIPSR